MAKLEEILPFAREGKKITRLEWGPEGSFDTLTEHADIPKDCLLSDDWVVVDDARVNELRYKDCLINIRCEITGFHSLKTIKQFKELCTTIREFLPDDI